MADLVGMNYATNRPVAVAVDENGVVQVASVGAAQGAMLPNDVQLMRDEMANLQTDVMALQTDIANLSTQMANLSAQMTALSAQIAAM